MILYSTNCPKCKVLKTKLDNSEYEYDIITDEEEMIKKGFTKVPILELDNGLRLTFVAAMAFLDEDGKRKRKVR